MQIENMIKINCVFKYLSIFFCFKNMKHSEILDLATNTSSMYVSLFKTWNTKLSHKIEAQVIF